jgi:hypothetical protein
MCIGGRAIFIPHKLHNLSFVTGSAEWVQRCRKLTDELEWLRDLTDKLTAENKNLMKDNKRLKRQLKTQEEDRGFLIKQLVAVKKENSRLRFSFEKATRSNIVPFEVCIPADNTRIRAFFCLLLLLLLAAAVHFIIAFNELQCWAGSVPPHSPFLLFLLLITLACFSLHIRVSRRRRKTLSKATSLRVHTLLLSPTPPPLRIQHPSRRQ